MSQQPYNRRIAPATLLACSLWTILIGGSAIWDMHSAEQETMNMAYSEAKANLNKDMSFRRWATEHGGVYVPITDKQQPVPWLAHIPNRDITTTDGQKLTLLNPASMLRQVMERYKQDYGVTGRIIGLKTLNPNNKPDEWERTQLETFSQGGLKETWAVMQIDGKPNLRYLRAMFMEPGCDKCHGILGYKTGDMRGAIGVNLPLTNYLQHIEEIRHNLATSHGIVWFSGIIGILYMMRRIRQNELRILDANERLEANVEKRTAELTQSLHNSFIKDAAIASSINAMVFVDLNNRITYVNQSFVDLWRISGPERAIGCPISDFLNKNEQTQMLQKALHSFGHWFGDLHVQLHDNSYADVQLSASMVRDTRGNPVCILGSFVDITAQKQIEHALIDAKQAAEAASRTKSEFLANMSHEIRTPMNAILGLTQLVLESGLPSRQEEFLKKAHASARALLGILNDILDYSKIEAGHMTIEHVPINLEDALSHLADLFGSVIDEKGLELFIEISPDTPIHIIGDPLRLSQVLTNLVSNAIKFTEHGEIYIKTELLKKTDQQANIQISVQDSGIGLTETQVSRLFQSFTQGDESTTRKYGGTGLGLSICQRLVSLMGGTIYATGRERSGSTFTFSISVGLAAEQPTPRDITQLQGLNVLIADDQTSSRRVIRQQLEQWQVKVEEVNSGEDTITHLKNSAQNGQKIDVLLLDWRMPNMDGLEVIRRLTQYTNQGMLAPRLNVMLVSVNDKEKLLSQPEATQLSGVLNKPVLPSQLFEVLTHCTHPHAAAMTRQQQKKQSKDLQGLRILLVEDNKTNRLMAGEFLERRGVLLSMACDGAEAVERVKQQSFDIILMDLHMPVMDGLESTMHIRTLPEGKTVPIIAMTAAVLQEDVDRCTAAGMVDFIAKPIDPDTVVNTLLKWSKPRSQVSSRTELPERIEIGDAVLPNTLPGFDLPTALRRLDGNRNLLAKLLLNFAQDHQYSYNKIEALISVRDYAQARMLLHTIKGAAANLGATALSEAAEIWEQEIKNDNGTSQQQAFAHSLNIALEAITQHVKTVQTHPQTEVTTIDHSLYNQTLPRILPYLIQQELIPDELMKILYKLTRSTPVPPALVRLLQQIDNFDHDGAIKSLHELAEQQGVTL